MSSAEVTTGPTRQVPTRQGAAVGSTSVRRVDDPPRTAGVGRFLGSELRLVLGRRRNLVLLAVLACAPIALGIAVDVSPPGGGGDGPNFLSQVTQNGLFLVFTSLTITLPLFLPLAVAIAAGDAVAGESTAGTLRNLLVVPVGRTRLLAVKYVGILVYAALCTLTVAVVGLVVGLVLFPHGAVTLLSGDSVPYSSALGRAALVAVYVVVSLTGVAAIGLFVSTLTEVPVAAVAAVAVLTVLSQIIDAVPQVAVLHPYLFTHPWMAFGELLRGTVAAGPLVHGVLTQLAYVVVFAAAAWARLTTKDISS